MQVNSLSQNHTNFKAWSKNPFTYEGLYKQKEYTCYTDELVNYIKQCREIKKFVAKHGNVSVKLGAKSNNNGCVESALTFYYDKIITNKFMKFLYNLFNISIKQEKKSLYAISNNNKVDELYKFVACVEEHECQLYPNTRLHRDIMESNTPISTILDV